MQLEVCARLALGRSCTDAELGPQRVNAIGPDVGTSALLFAASQKPDPTGLHT